MSGGICPYPAMAYTICLRLISFDERRHQTRSHAIARDMFRGCSAAAGLLVDENFGGSHPGLVVPIIRIFHTEIRYGTEVAIPSSSTRKSIRLKRSRMIPPPVL